MKQLPLILTILMLCYACNPEEESGSISCNPVIDQTNINNALNTIPQCISQIEQGEAIEILNNFVEFNQGEAIEMFDTEELEEWAQNIATLVTENVLNLDVEGDWDNLDWTGGDIYQFDFDSNIGVYTWNPGTSNYDVSPGGSSIDIIFPSDPDQNSNNATFRMTNYSDYFWQANGDNEIIYMPTSMFCELEVDNEVIFSINHSVSFNDSFWVDGNEIPNSISVQIFVNPVTVQLEANRVNPTLFSATLSINSASCDIIATAETQLLTTNYLDILNDSDVWMEEMDYISLDISVAEMTLDGIMDCQVLYDISESSTNDQATTAEINAATAVDVVYQGNEIASLVLVDTDADTDVDGLHIVYCDNSQESVVNYINPLMNSIETILYPYAGAWWDDIEE